MFSKACEYGIKACIFLAEDRDLRGSYDVKTISSQTSSPEYFTAKILQKLKKDGIVYSNVGANGGYYIPEKGKVTLSRIVDSIDGEGIYKGCGLGLEECNATMPCPVHDHFVKIRNDLKIMLESTTIEMLKDGLRNGETFLMR